MTITKSKNQDKIFVLKEKIKETPDIVTLKFLPVENGFFSFKPGQFVMAYFSDGRLGNLGKPYSISSAPQDEFLTITVKKLGVFSSALHSLKKGDRMKLVGPYGDFCPDKSMKNLVFLAGGIGVAPFYSTIRNFYLEKSPDKITLFYSNRTKKDIVFFKQLNEMAKDWPNLKPHYLLTREETREKIICEYCRINSSIIKNYLGDLKDKHYFICGPNAFVDDLRQELKNSGVQENFIRTEAFY